MSATVDTAMAVGSSRMLFQAADLVNFEPSTDGSRFLAQFEERSNEPPVHLLINWPALLRGEK
jgi:hypothetical protein